MSLASVSAVLLAMLLLSAGGTAPQAPPVPIFVTHLETAPLPPLTPKEHEAASTRTREEMFTVAAQLRKQHGDNTKAWPPDVWQVFYAAEDAHTLAVARPDYQSPDTRRGLADSVEDFIRGAGGNKGMPVVASADEAVLVVQITGRRRISAPGPTDNRYFIRFRLAPGAKMTNERFLDLTRGFKWNDPWTKLIARGKDGSVYVDLEAGSMASYKNCAGMVRAIVWRFIGATLAQER